MQKELDKIKRDNFINRYYEHLETNNLNAIIQDINTAKENLVDNFQLITIGCVTDNIYAIESIFNQLSQTDKDEYLYLSILFATGTSAINVMDYFLLNYPASNNFLNKALTHAITLKQPEAILHLISKYKDLDVCSGDNIRIACETGNPTIVNLIIENSLKSRNLYNQILEYSLNAEFFNIADMAIELGADINHNNQRCMNTAISYNRKKAILYLGKNGADLTEAINKTQNEADKNNYISLHIAMLEEMELSKTKPVQLSNKKKNLNL